MELMDVQVSVPFLPPPSFPLLSRIHTWAEMNLQTCKTDSSFSKPSSAFSQSKIPSPYHVLQGSTWSGSWLPLWPHFLKFSPFLTPVWSHWLPYCSRYTHQTHSCFVDFALTSSPDHSALSVDICMFLSSLNSGLCLPYQRGLHWLPYIKHPSLPIIV